jgi:hypothetical protein
MRDSIEREAVRGEGFGILARGMRGSRHFWMYTCTGRRPQPVIPRARRSRMGV